VEGTSEHHGAIGGRAIVYIGGFVFEHDLGEVFISGSRFTFPGSPPSWLAPDVAFVSAARLSRIGFSDGYSRRIPDLVLEVKPPSNTEADIHEKVSIYLGGGVRIVWLVRPIERTGAVFRPHGPERILDENDVLDGEDVLPGFRRPLSELFRGPRGSQSE
ncbi:MAG TPA: Uma2 family endonuclease, partial [Thermomicrobiales bacterium]|nr:Uma2 family endonuclease [Thermomicrobiales bacterium]